METAETLFTKERPSLPPRRRPLEAVARPAIAECRLGQPIGTFLPYGPWPVAEGARSGGIRPRRAW